MSAPAALLVAGALAGCRASEAGPTSGLTAPAGWKAMPELASAASDAAKQANITVDGVEAWGEPARGCYAAWLGIRGAGGAPSTVAEPMIASLSNELPGLIVTDVVKPAANADAGVLSLAFTRPPYRGRVRAAIAKSGAMGVLACFWNLREPIACESACTALIGGMQ